MLGKWKKSRIFKILNYLAERKSRSTIKDLNESHSRHIRELNSGTIETIQSFRNQYDDRINLLKKEENRTINDLHHESERKIRAIDEESTKIKIELNDTINQLSKEISRVTKSEHVYENGFMKITSELKWMLPQIRAALQAIQISYSNIEAIHQSVQTDIDKIKKTSKVDDIIRKNNIKAR
jgi:type I site-specific restriction endonuclease